MRYELRCDAKFKVVVDFEARCAARARVSAEIKCGTFVFKVDSNLEFEIAPRDEAVASGNILASGSCGTPELR